MTKRKKSFTISGKEILLYTQNLFIMKELFEISADKHSMLCATEMLATADIRDLLQSFCSEKIQKIKIGKMHIVNAYFPQLKDSKLAGYDGHYVFYAPAKKSFFAKATQMFIWPLGAKNVFALPIASVTFAKPDKDAEEKIPLPEPEQVLFHNYSKEEVIDTAKPLLIALYGSKEHLCFFEKMELFRKFAVSKKKMICFRDYSVCHLRWTDPDAWVKEHFTVTDYKEPMYFLKHLPKVTSIQISYPSRPPLWGYDIDE